MTVKGNHPFHTFIISQSSCAATIYVTLKLVAQFILILIRIWIIMSVTKNKGCGVALLNKLRHSPCLKIISVIFCNNACQVALWQYNHWHTTSWLLVSFYAKNKDKNPSHIMCLSITHKSCASHIPTIMHNAYMQVLDSLYALANNSRRVLHKTRHHNWMNYPHMYSRDFRNRRTWFLSRCMLYMIIIVEIARDVNAYVYNCSHISARFL